MQTGKSVSQWREQLNKQLRRVVTFNNTQPNKYSGYVYDAVWLYAYALDELVKKFPSYIQDLHSERSTNKFVEIIRNTSFNGVSGRINFVRGRNSRLSNIKVSILRILFDTSNFENLRGHCKTRHFAIN